MIKDALLIDNGRLVNFWAEIIDTSNYLQNKLFKKCFKCTIILVNRTFNTFGSLAVKQASLYLLKNIPNPIFISLGER